MSDFILDAPLTLQGEETVLHKSHVGRNTAHPLPRRWPLVLSVTRMLEQGHFPSHKNIQVDFWPIT